MMVRMIDSNTFNNTFHPMHAHTVIEIGFEHGYNTSASGIMVIVCAAIYKDSLERNVTILMVTLSLGKL